MSSAVLPRSQSAKDRVRSFQCLPHQLEFIRDTQTRSIALCGGFGCVAGETLINGVRVDSLAHVDSIEVNTLFGRAIASPAYRKGKADLYEVTTASGKSIRVTRAHRFLAPDGWQELRHLRIGSLIAVDGSENGLKSQGKAIGLKGAGLQDFRSCDELPSPQQAASLEILERLFVPNISLNLFEQHRVPLSIEDSCPLNTEFWRFLAQPHEASKSFQSFHREPQTVAQSSECFHSAKNKRLESHPCKDSVAQRPSLCLRGYTQPKSRCDLPSEPSHQSAQQYILRSNHLGTYRQPTETCSASHQLKPKHWRSLHQKHFSLCRSAATEDESDKPSSLKFCSSLKHFDALETAEATGDPLLSDCSQERTFFSLPLNLIKNNNSILAQSWDSIAEVKFIRHDFFYDLHVPFYEHYEAHGIYHHNSGKTKTLLLKTIDLAALNAGYKGALYAPTNELAVDILVPELDELLDRLKIPHKFKASPRPLYRLDFKHGSTLLYIRSFENYKRIVGQNLAFAGVDEIDTMKPEIARWAWQKLMGRIRSGRVNQLYTTSTPEGFKFLYQYFFKEAEGKTDRRLIRAKTTDNPFLPEQFITDLYENYPEQLVRAYVNGEFVNLTSGTVYYSYDRILNRSDRTVQDKDSLHIGADFNVGQMAATVHVMDGDRSDCVGEFSGIFDTPDLIRAIQNRYPVQCNEGRVYLYPDASGGARKTVNASTSDIVLLRQAGFAVYAPTVNPAIKDRVASLNTRLCNAEGVRRTFVNDREAPRTAEALEQQVYDANGMPDKSGGLDHLCFAADTLVQTGKGLMRIDAMDESGYVYTVGGHKVPYSGCQQVKVAKIVKVILSSGVEIKCTPDHLFLTTSGWVEAANLYGKQVCRIQSSFLPSSSHLRGLGTTGETKGKNITSGNMLQNTALFNTFIEPFGDFIAGKSQQIIMSTTKMGTPQTMPFQTLKCFPPQNIKDCTMKSERRRIQLDMNPSCEKGLIMQENLRLNGMALKRGANGIQKMQKLRFNETLKRFPLSFVLFVCRAFSPKCRSSNTAQRSATRFQNPEIGEHLESITRYGIANIAKSPLLAGNILRLNAVAVSAVEKIDGEQPVYCLTVPEWGCFALANGTIVSNCDSFGYHHNYHFPIASVTGFSTTRAQYA